MTVPPGLAASHSARKVAETSRETEPSWRADESMCSSVGMEILRDRSAMVPTFSWQLGLP